jgi:hypothetical protein
MFELSIVNQSTQVTASELAAYQAAQYTQIWRDFTPAWNYYCELDRFTYPQHNPPAELIIVDDATQADALGYHDIDSLDHPVGFVFAKTALGDGVSWTSVASHELLELLADPWINLLAQGTFGGKPAIYAFEVADPVEGDSYQIEGVTLSNFVLPPWFQLGHKGPYDFLNKLTQPFSLSPGGYVSYMTTIGNWQQSFGDQRGQHTKDPKYSRPARRKWSIWNFPYRSRRRYL